MVKLWPNFNCSPTQVGQFEINYCFAIVLAVSDFQLSWRR